MTLHVIGKIIMQSTKCEKCNGTIYFKEKINNVKCNNCGGIYELIENLINDSNIERKYNFIEFQCIFELHLKKCNNNCPAPGMYCMDHVSDEKIEIAKKTISYSKDKLQSAENILEQMEESKKIWLIQEVSRINE